MLRLALLLALLAAPAQARSQEVEPDEARAIAALIPEAIQEGDLEGAREMLRAAVEALEEPETGEEEEHVAFLQELDAFAKQLGSLQQALRLRETVLAIRLRLLPPDHPDLLAAQQNLAGTRYALGDLQGAHELFEAVLEARTRLLPPDHPDHLAAKQNLANTRYALGDLAGAHELEEAVLEARTRLLPPEHPDLLDAKGNLAATRYELGDLQGAHKLFEAVLEARTRLLPPEHPDLLDAKGNLAATRKALGDLQGARELEEAVLEARTRLLPPEHPQLLGAKLNLAGTRYALGDLQGAHELLEAVLEARTRLLPPEHPDLLSAQQNLAASRMALGDLQGAHELFEAVLEAQTRLLPPEHPDLLTAKQNLAVTRNALGDLQGARELEEAVLKARTRLLPPDHPDLLGAKLNLAATRNALGDLQGARELEEAVLEARTRLLPPEHPQLLGAKLNLAATQRELGDLQGAHELFEAVLEAQTRLLPPDHPDLLAAKQNLAVTRKALGDFAGTRELEEAVLAARTRLFPPDHPFLLLAQQNLAVTRRELGDLAGAHELEEAVLAARTRLLPPDHPHLLLAQQNLAVTRIALGDLAGARELVASLLAGMRVRAEALREEAPRPAREGARAELQRLSGALFSSASVDPEGTLSPQLFATLEELRLASVASGEAAHALIERPELAGEARAVAGIRARLSDLAAAGPEDEDGAKAWRAELLALTEERDRAERDLRRKLSEAGAFAGEIEAKAVGAQLKSGAAAVSFLRYLKYFEKDAETGETPPSVDSLLAFVVCRDGSVQRIELGAAAELEALVQDWRAALGRPLFARGIDALDAGSSESDLQRAGERLHERVLAPVLAAAGDARRLHVALDDVLYLVPLDALPLEGGLVGERVTIHVEATLSRLIRPRREMDSGLGLTLAGGVDYDAEPAVGTLTSLDAATPPLEGKGERSGSSRGAFAFLPGTAAESRSIAELHAVISDREPVLLSGGAATKAALFAAAPRTRYLHLATHGWFASESFKSQLDTLAEQGSREAFDRAQETLTGFAPETLCGLALSGANRGKDALGHVPGILTAEELASFDLRNCELAVLSACETNVGIRRAGQGIQSLQTALHAAGARTAITSLWKVDDAATRRLFELFYTKLWKEKLGKHAALWQAKMALRAEGHPPRDWAGWVLSGDPE